MNTVEKYVETLGKLHKALNLSAPTRETHEKVGEAKACIFFAVSLLTTSLGLPQETCESVTEETFVSLVNQLNEYKLRSN